MAFCSNDQTLCIVTGGLGGGVVVLGLIYFYIYCTKLRQHKWDIFPANKRHSEGSQPDLHNTKGERGGDGGRRGGGGGKGGGKVHPFALVAGASKLNKASKT